MVLYPFSLFKENKFMNTSIVASGIKQDIGTRVVLWDEPGGLNSYPAKRFNAHNDDLEKLRKRIQGFVIHHSASWTAKTTFSGAAARGFSVNFIIDDDLPESGVATIYQCLDIKDAGWSQGSWNDLGSGVEIAVQPARWIDPNYYSEANQKKYGVSLKKVIVSGELNFPPSFVLVKFNLFSSIKTLLSSTWLLKLKIFLITKLLPNVSLSFLGSKEIFRFTLR